MIRRLALFLVFAASSCFGQLWSGILDPTRAIDWTQAGAGTIPTTYVQVGGIVSAYTGNTNTINNALAACDGTTGQYVQLGTGTFTLSSGGTSNGVVISKSKCALRGNGPTLTKLVFGAGSHDGCGGENGNICFSGAGVDGSTPDNTASINSGATQGSTSIVISANVTGATKLVVGQTMMLDLGLDGTIRSQDTGNIFVCLAAPACTQAGGGGDGRSGRPELQFVKVLTISAGSCPCTVTFTPGVFMPNYMTGSNPQASWNNTNPFKSGMGLENLSIDGSGDALSSGGSLSEISTIGITNSWIKNIISIVKKTEPVTDGNTHRHVRVYMTSNFTIRDSYFVGRAGVDDYAINCYLCGNTLVENNIIQHINTPFLNEQGSGLVYGYNFTVDNIWHDGTWAQGSVYGHGGQHSYYLAEGNVAYGSEFENYFGPAFFITNFRNRYFGFQPGNDSQTVPAFQYGLNRYFNYVGNVMGDNNRHTAYQQNADGSLKSCGNGWPVYSIGLGSNCFSGNTTGTTINQVGGINSSATSVTVASTSGFDASGVLVIDSEIMTYASISGNTFNGLTRCPAYYYTTCASHVNGASVSLVGHTWPVDDPFSVTTTMRWGNYAACTGDAACNADRFVNAEVPSGLSLYANAVPANHNLPASFYLSAKPTWWPSSKPWPAIGPDVTGGNLGFCSGGSYAGWPATDASQCTGGSLGSGGVNGKAYSNPAMDCYFSLGGTPSGGGTGNAAVLTNFDATVCYAGSISIPTIDASNCPMPGATQGAAYGPVQITGTGNPTPTWDLSAGAFPTGITMTTGGSVSGTPTTVQTANFTLRATNSEGSATLPCSLSVIHFAAGFSGTTIVKGNIITQ